MRVWRLCTKRHADTAFSGIGNRKVGSRWVPAGYLAVYASERISLAVLETLVPIDPRHFRNNFVLLPADIPDALTLEGVEIDSLPDHWRDAYEDSHLQAVGRDWIERGDSAVLVVPSAVVPEERNFILNPQHPDFVKIEIGDAEPFAFDGRLVP
ncbi:MAG: RES family NAD+ phosphorylase [Candidatus Thiodiazotropha sp. (ex Epidulcina cf. delphinae)]|nr:RES family NAD+ phosphorylase [Candidatus Thiodiazotropha sp. (ex Epidulcina cf. delphinae)]